MQYTTLGKTDLKVSRLCLGCMTFGEPDRGNHAWTLPEESSRPIIKRAIDGGINFFDTANSYSDGSSEEIVGRALRDFARRDDVVVATKVYYPSGDLAEGLSRAQILRSIDDSLRRLNMDYVDLLQIHRWDYNTPIEETLEALNDVVKAGKARYIVESGRRKILKRHLAYHEGNSLSQQHLLTKVMMAQHLCACPFIKSNVAGVVDHTTGIGIFVIDTYRPSKQRCIHFTSR